MKTKHQAWGWLAAGVLAAGLNASSFDGGLQRAHRIADHVVESSGAVLALFTGQTNQFLTQARLLAARDQTSMCSLTTMIARVKSAVIDQIASSQSNASPQGIEIAKLMAARPDAQFPRTQTRRARMNEEIAARTAHFRVMAAFAPVVLKPLPVPATCSRIRVSVPAIPVIRMPATPTLHLETASTDPI
jgi:hypothetical protein